MHSTPNYNRYSDALVLKRRRVIIKRFVLSIFIGLVLIAVTGYFLFFTPHFRITSISVNGLKTIEPEEVESLINSAFFQNSFSVFKLITIRKQKNILFFDADAALDKILAQFPVIKSVEIRKEYPHKLIFDFVERKPIGTWCFNASCNYFDDEGILWGKALKSFGSLLLTVEDKRGDTGTSAQIESGLLESIKKITAGFDNIGIGVRKIEIPTGSINDLMVHTAKDYYVLADSSANIDKQLDTLRIFFKNKGADFNQEYIDIRLEGRVYYK